MAKTIEDYEKTIANAKQKLRALKQKEAEKMLKDDAKLGQLLYGAMGNFLRDRGCDRERLLSMTKEEIHSVIFNQSNRN